MMQCDSSNVIFCLPIWLDTTLELLSPFESAGLMREQLSKSGPSCSTDSGAVQGRVRKQSAGSPHEHQSVPRPRLQLTFLLATYLPKPGFLTHNPTENMIHNNATLSEVSRGLLQWTLAVVRGPMYTTTIQSHLIDVAVHRPSAIAAYA